ncbi:MAG: trigger factor [Mogibacterium sp.]|nr:trigger factor [Mogibacterium sp.]
MRKQLRKFITAALAAAMVLALTACGGKGVDIPKTYQYDDLSQYITLADYSALTYTEVNTEVTDQEVQSYINDAITQATGEKDVKEGKVEKDSVIKVDFTGKIDGEEFSGGTAVGYQINMATDTFIDGFKEGILGHNVGDTFDLNLRFPDDYGETSLAGKDVVFTVTVKALVQTVKPEYNDAFVQEYTDFETTAEYEADIRSKLTDQKVKDAEAQQKSELFSTILDGSEIVAYPETELEASKEDMRTTYTELAEQYAMEYADFLTTYLGMTEEEFETQVQQSSENQVKQQLVLRALAKELEIEVSKQDYNDFLAGLLEDAGFTEESFEEYAGMTIADYAVENDLFAAMLYEKTMSKVLEMSTPAKN